MTRKEHLLRELSDLSDTQVEEVARYLQFLRFKARSGAVPAIDERTLAKLYAESADEDRELAEAGMADYQNALADEDAR